MTAAMLPVVLDSTNFSGKTLTTHGSLGVKASDGAAAIAWTPGARRNVAAVRGTARERKRRLRRAELLTATGRTSENRWTGHEDLRSRRASEVMPCSPSPWADPTTNALRSASILRRSRGRAYPAWPEVAGPSRVSIWVISFSISVQRAGAMSCPFGSTRRRQPLRRARHAGAVVATVVVRQRSGVTAPGVRCGHACASALEGEAERPSALSWTSARGGRASALKL